MIKHNYINILVAALLTVVVAYFLPEDSFSRFNLQIEQRKKAPPGTMEYYLDINNDGNLERVRYEREDELGRVFDVTRENTFIANYNMPQGELAISKKLTAGDINQNDCMDFYFVSANKHLAWLNILEYDTLAEKYFSIRKVVLDSVRIYNHKPDVENQQVHILDNQKLLIYLYAGYAIQPRQVYVYDIGHNKLIKGISTSIAMLDLKVIKHKSGNYYLPTGCYASDNTIPLDTHQKFSISKNQDTIALYETYKNKAYAYGDFSAYTLLYNSNLNFVFPPIEYPGYTSYTQMDYILNGDDFSIFTINGKTNEQFFNKEINITNLEGEIIESKKIGSDNWQILQNNDLENVYIKNENKLLLINQNLDTVNLIAFPENQRILGFLNIDNKGGDELVCTRDGELRVYSPNFRHLISTSLNINNLDISIVKIFKTLHVGISTFFNLQLDDTSLIISYTSNPIYYLYYPALLLIFGFWLLVFWGITRLNNHRLLAENLRLENLVNRRTRDLKDKNILLQDQKEELNTQAEELRTTNDHLNELSTFKEMMTNTVIHDLKNPLNTIIHLSANNKILQPAENMLNLVMNILDIQKYETSKMVLNKKVFALDDLVTETISKLKLMMEARNIKLDKIYSSELTLFADKEALERVMINLLMNAIKFSPLNGTITLEADLQSSGQAEIRIMDQGPGIPKDKLEHIFNKFEQAEKRKAGSIMSSGIGLTFCKLAIEAHNGSIVAQNQNSGGAMLILTLPMGGKKQTPVSEPRAVETKNKISLTPVEFSLLLPLIDKLKSMKAYQASDVLKAIGELKTDNQNISLWAEAIKRAVFSGNKDLYEKLLNLDVENQE